MEILIPIALFAMIAAIVVMPRYFKSLERQKTAELMRAAIERGQPLPPEIVDAMSSNVRTPGLPPSPQRDLRTGVIWLAVALAFVALAIVSGFEEPEHTYGLLGVAAFPGFIGLAFIVLSQLNKPKS
jgi:hypothetical protein